VLPGAGQGVQRGLDVGWGDDDEDAGAMLNVAYMVCGGMAMPALSAPRYRPQAHRPGEHVLLALLVDARARVGVHGC
jgi:hypothetical protein